MIESFTEGFLLGLGAAIPLGPINILIMNNALKSYKAGVALGFGAMSADILYLVLSLAGMIGFLNNSVLLNTVGIVGSFFLLYLAYGIFKSREKKLEVQTQSVKTKNIFKIYTQGFVLTFLNPYTIVFWFSVAGYTANKNLDIAFTLLGMISSITLWTTLMPYLVHRSKHKISQRASKYLSLASALILFGFALSLFVDVAFL
ncbi:LysE family translocator [bacterium]|nr:LysE family translocator [bacterium]MBU1434644.1 LysE family translocator [bacterium]MBU1502222.1 LysE family translocator [bacterium]